MKRALIDYQNTVVQVEPLGGDFAVASDFHWRDCPDECVAYVWTWDGNTFAPPPGPSLDSVRALKLAQITKDRDAACFADATALGHLWQADSRSQQMLASAILLAQAGVYTPTVWRDANNVDVPIANVAQLVAIAGAMAAQTQAAYAQSWARKQALEAATTVEQIEGV